MSGRDAPVIERRDVVRLWLARQGLSRPRSASLTRRRFVDHLERVGALQLDGVNAVDRAHYLTLWSRYGPYRRATVDRWVYDDRLAYEYWGHEASILPIGHLPQGRRRMQRFPPPSWQANAWWSRYQTSTASKRRVLKRLRDEGPLESVDFDWRKRGAETEAGFPLMKEDKRTLKLLWHSGRIAVASRRHFRCVYDLAERVLPEGPAATTREYHDGWLLIGLSGNGVASERHLINYFTAPNLNAPERKAAIARNVAAGRIVEVEVPGARGPFYALPEHLDELPKAPDPEGTTLLSPFDSLLWQRGRAAELLRFDYKVEIYVPPAKRRFGYYVMPILHAGRLVGRLDPKLHRDEQRLEIKAIHFEPKFVRDRSFDKGLRDTLESLARFLGASRLDLPASEPRAVR